jgi:hypothetical protein
MKITMNANRIKLIAIAAMTLDHVAWMAFPGYSQEPLALILHVIGRMTCPMMCYFVAEGYHHTRNINKYTARLFLFALISHFPYLLASADFAGPLSWIPFYHGEVLNQTGVMWSLAWGLVMLRIAHCESLKNGWRALLILLICVVSFPSDWSCIAALCVLAFGTNRGNFKAQMLWMLFYVAIYATVYFFALDRVYGILQMAVVLAIPVLATYNGERGKDPRINKLMKWGFYVYYPLHLLVIGLLLHAA